MRNWSSFKAFLRCLILGFLLTAAAGCFAPADPQGGRTPQNSSEEKTTALPAESLEPTIPQKPTSTLLSLDNPGLPETSPAQCGEFSGTIQKYTFQPSRTEALLEGQIYLPPCYRGMESGSFPVIYLLHGAESTAEQWDALGIDETADRLIAREDIPPIILVLPDEPSGRHPSETPFGEQVVKDLIPWIDSHYRTLDSRDYRAIGGISRGGNWAIRMGLLHWSSFSRIGAHSTPLFRGDLQRIPDWMGGIPETMMPAIYLDIGGGDQHLAQARELEEMLQSLGVPYEWHQNPGLHTEEYWQSHLEDYLVWYTQDW